MANLAELTIDGDIAYLTDSFELKHDLIKEFLFTIHVKFLLALFRKSCK